jgi:hypothetical protein
MVLPATGDPVTRITVVNSRCTAESRCLSLGPIGRDGSGHVVEARLSLGFRFLPCGFGNGLGGASDQVHAA